MNPLISKARKLFRQKGYDIVQHRDLPVWLALHNIDVVLDIGANDGRYASEIREAGWAGRIISFEPQPDVFERLKTRMAGDSAWQGFQMGLGNTEGELAMNAHGLDVLSSFLPSRKKDDTTRVIHVPVKRPEFIFDEIMEGCCRPFVKIDTQGYELEIIRGFGKRTDDVIGWQLELSIKPLYEGQPLIDEIIFTMRSKGQALWRILPGLRDPATLQAFELDGIFFKTT